MGFSRARHYRAIGTLEGDQARTGDRRPGEKANHLLEGVTERWLWEGEARRDTFEYAVKLLDSGVFDEQASAPLVATV